MGWQRQPEPACIQWCISLPSGGVEKRSDGVRQDEETYPFEITFLGKC